MTVAASILLSGDRTGDGDATYRMVTLEPMPWCVAHNGMPIAMPTRDSRWQGQCTEDEQMGYDTPCDIRTDHTSGVWREVHSTGSNQDRKAKGSATT